MIESGTLLQNRYRVTAQIGQGGMGAVYVATDERFRSTVAVKQTFFDDPALLRAFEREAILLNRLRHAALPRVSDHFTEGEGQFLVMEFVEGSDFSELLQKRAGPFPLPEVLRWADDLLDALEYLHAQQPAVVHRDIKPQNLKLTPQGRVVLLDFGLAKGDAGQTRANTTASVFGYSRNYAPLEQIQGTGTDTRSDLYSLAATLYHLLTGQAPADALTRATAVINNQPDPLRPAHRAHHQVPASVGDILHRAMNLNPALRPRAAADVRAALRQAAAALAKTLPAQPPPPSASNDATMVDAPTGPPNAWPHAAPSPYAAAPPSHTAMRGTTQMRRAALSQSEATFVEAAHDTTRLPGRAYAAASSDEPADETRRKLSPKLIVLAAVALLVVCAAVPLTIMRNAGAPAVDSDTRTRTTGEASTDEEPDSAGASVERDYDAAADTTRGAGGASSETRPAATPSAGATPETSSQAAGGDAKASEQSGSNAPSGSSPEDAGALSGGGASSGRSGLVLHEAAPNAVQANAEEEARRIEQQRRAEDQRRAQPASPTQQAYPPPGWHPPPGHRPPPRDRRFP